MCRSVQLCYLGPAQTAIFILFRCFFHRLQITPFVLSYHDTEHCFSCSFCFNPISFVTQIPVLPVDTVPHLHVCCLKFTISMSSVSPLSYLSFKSVSSPQPLFLICHVSYVVSVLHTTFYKKHFLLSCRLSVLSFFFKISLPVSSLMCPSYSLL